MISRILFFSALFLLPVQASASREEVLIGDLGKSEVLPTLENETLSTVSMLNKRANTASHKELLRRVNSYSPSEILQFPNQKITLLEVTRRIQDDHAPFMTAEELAEALQDPLVFYRRMSDAFSNRESLPVYGWGLIPYLPEQVGYRKIRALRKNEHVEHMISLMDRAEFVFFNAVVISDKLSAEVSGALGEKIKSKNIPKVNLTFRTRENKDNLEHLILALSGGELDTLRINLSSEVLQGEDDFNVLLEGLQSMGVNKLIINTDEERGLNTVGYIDFFQKLSSLNNLRNITYEGLRSEISDSLPHTRVVFSEKYEGMLF